MVVPRSVRQERGKPAARKVQAAYDTELLAFSSAA
jgi:hypothetical protein